MNLIDKDALIEELGIETDCDECEHEKLKYHCDLDPVEACTKIIEAPVITVTTESAEKAIDVLKNAAWLGAVYSFEETEEAVKTAIRALQAVSTQHNVHDFPKDADCISRQAVLAEFNCCELTPDGGIDVNYAIEFLEQLPSAQPETAKRIVGKSRDGMTLWYQCDMCNEPVDAQDGFCRGCGRRLTDE